MGFSRKKLKKYGIPGGSMQKKENSRGVTVNLTINPGVNSKKSISSTGGGVQSFSGKAECTRQKY